MTRKSQQKKYVKTKIYQEDNNSSLQFWPQVGGHMLAEWNNGQNHMTSFFPSSHLHLSLNLCVSFRELSILSLSLPLLPLPLPPTQFLSYWQLFTHLLIHIFSLLLSFLLYFSLPLPSSDKNICFQTWLWHGKKYIDIIAHCTEMCLYWNRSFMYQDLPILHISHLYLASIQFIFKC